MAGYKECGIRSNITLKSSSKISLDFDSAEVNMMCLIYPDATDGMPMELVEEAKSDRRVMVRKKDQAREG